MTDLIKRMRGWRCLDFAAAADMLSEASDALERTQWQPIETAPDKVDILLYQDGWAINPVIVGRRHGHTWLSDCFDIDSADQRPTYWMHLPPIPK